MYTVKNSPIAYLAALAMLALTSACGDNTGSGSDQESDSLANAPQDQGSSDLPIYNGGNGSGGDDDDDADEDYDEDDGDDGTGGNGDGPDCEHCDGDGGDAPDDDDLDPDEDDGRGGSGPRDHDDIGDDDGDDDGSDDGAWHDETGILQGSVRLFDLDLDTDCGIYVLYVGPNGHDWSVVQAGNLHVDDYDYEAGFINYFIDGVPADADRLIVAISDDGGESFQGAALVHDRLLPGEIKTVVPISEETTAEAVVYMDIRNDGYDMPIPELMGMLTREWAQEIYHEGGSLRDVSLQRASRALLASHTAFWEYAERLGIDYDLGQIEACGEFAVDQLANMANASPLGVSDPEVGTYFLRSLVYSYQRQFGGVRELAQAAAVGSLALVAVAVDDIQAEAVFGLNPDEDDVSAAFAAGAAWQSQFVKFSQMEIYGDQGIFRDEREYVEDVMDAATEALLDTGNVLTVIDIIQTAKFDTFGNMTFDDANNGLREIEENYLHGTYGWDPSNLMSFEDAHTSWGRNALSLITATYSAVFRQDRPEDAAEATVRVFENYEMGVVSGLEATLLDNRDIAEVDAIALLDLYLNYGGIWALVAIDRI